MTWEDIIDLEKQKDYYKSLEKEINKRYETTTVFPEKQNIFKAFSLTKLDNLKVVILGQDPYHGFGQAQGLAFSTPTIKICTPAPKRKIVIANKGLEPIDSPKIQRPKKR